MIKYISLNTNRNEVNDWYLQQVIIAIRSIIDLLSSIVKGKLLLGLEPDIKYITNSYFAKCLKDRLFVTKAASTLMSFAIKRM